ncbi:alanine racemase [Arthrobacter sp. NPDC056886]|uniref:alanine racemase n=1 Tax=Arthrobacter sp. NPDC056886 TaxID=3345960 RepID=UPI00366E0B24
MSRVTFDLPRALREGTILPIAPDDPELDTPALLVDLDIVDANIARMQVFADSEGFLLRPHAKSHKSLAIANRQLQARASGLCVATPSEAEVLGASSADDILVAYPLVGARKLERVAELALQGRLTLVSDSLNVTAGYRDFASRLGVTIPVLVEVDTGMNRAGVEPPLVPGIALDVARSPSLEFLGIMTHAGHAHDAPTADGIAIVARREAQVMGDVRADLERAGLVVPVVSAGSTLTSPFLRASDGITEIRPGTYVYNDLRTLGRFACEPENIAASMLATIVSINGTRITMDAGNKTLTSSRDAVYGYGRLAEREDVVVARMSEEHGVLAAPTHDHGYSVGDRVRILPIHVCVWMDLQSEVYGTRGGVVVETISVDGMRRSL